MSVSKKNIPAILALLISGFLLLSSCDKKQEVVRDLQIKDLPSLSARNAETIYSDSGKVTMVVRTPHIQQFTGKDDPHTLFPEGLKVIFYDRSSQPQASISANFARYTEKDEQWELRDSVVAISTEGDILETELLYWNEPRDRLWSDRFVRITGKDKIIMGTGFESDTRFTWYKFKNIEQSYIIVDEQKNPSDN